MEKKIEDLIEYYYNRIDEIDRKYFFTQDKEMGRIDFKKRSKTDILIKEIYEDFLEDLKKLNN